MSEPATGESDFGSRLPERGRKSLFSQRTAWDMAESDWARALRERRESNLPLFDLTVSNPTHCGFNYNPAETLGPLANPGALNYDPDPHGMLSAREAVCRYYDDHGATVTPEQIFLTTSTSEGYSFLFRLLCDPGDEVLIAQPSYPLVDFLATLDDVRLVPYPLFYDYGWHIDFETLRRRFTPRTRALVVVNPNNPTGHFIGAAERAQLEAVCVEYGLALIVDEVFLDYPMADSKPGEQGRRGTFAACGSSGRESRTNAKSSQAVTFILSGISKIAALPQMKASWIVCLGPPAELAEAVNRVEVIADTFLSMNAPVQHALPNWLAARGSIQAQIRGRISNNLATLDRELGNCSEIDRLEGEAGWSAILRIPAVRPDDETALRLLEDHGLAVHSGSLYGFKSSGRLVISLLPDEQTFSHCVAPLLHAISDLR